MYSSNSPVSVSSFPSQGHQVPFIRYVRCWRCCGTLPRCGIREYNSEIGTVRTPKHVAFRSIVASFSITGYTDVVLGVCIFIPTVISVLLSPLFFLVRTLPTQPLLSISTYYRMTSLTHSTSIFHPIPITVRNAHLAESQAELCAANVATYLSLSPSSASKGMLKYPQGIFGVPEVPLLACVSLGKSDQHLTMHQIQSKIDF
jgi:hypothetical protein